MPFKKILEELTLRSRAAGAILLDWEGEQVESFSTSQAISLPLIGAHKGIILNKLKAAAASQSAVISSFSVSTKDVKLAVSMVKDGYYLVVALEKENLTGRAFHESRKAIKKIEKEMG